MGRDRNDAPSPNFDASPLRSRPNDGGFDEQACGVQHIQWGPSWRHSRTAGRTGGVIAMSSAEELTLVVGRWLRPIVAVLNVVHRLKPASTSSREQPGTAFDR